jgi:hypothetical protein
MAPFFWRFQAREASGRSLATPLLREIQGDPRRIADTVGFSPRVQFNTRGTDIRSPR